MGMLPPSLGVVAGVGMLCTAIVFMVITLPLPSSPVPARTVHPQPRGAITFLRREGKREAG